MIKQVDPGPQKVKYQFVAAVAEDPEKNPDATMYDRIHGDDVIRKNLKVMDMTAFTLCKDSEMDIIVFNMETKGNLTRILHGEDVGTLVTWKSITGA